MLSVVVAAANDACNNINRNDDAYAVNAFDSSGGSDGLADISSLEDDDDEE